MGEIRMSSSVENLLSKNLDDLYEELGRSLITPELPRTGSVTRQNAVQRGKSFVSGSLEKLRAKICVDWHSCNKTSEYGDFQSLAYAVAPLVSRGAAVPSSRATSVTTIFVKCGLEQLWQ